MSNVNEVSDATFEEEVIQSDKPVVVDFWAPWCGPCRVIGPILEQMSDQHGGKVKFLKLNVDDNPQTSARYQIFSIPTVILFEGGAPAEREVGARSKGHYEGLWARWIENENAA